MACLKFNFDKSKRYEVIVIDKKKYGFVIKTLYGLHYVCILAMKIRNEMHIQLDEINHHQQTSYFEEIMSEDCFSGKDNEWNGIQEHLKKVP